MLPVMLPVVSRVDVVSYVGTCLERLGKGGQRDLVGIVAGRGTMQEMVSQC